MVAHAPQIADPSDVSDWRCLGSVREVWRGVEAGITAGIAHNAPIVDDEKGRASDSYIKYPPGRTASYLPEPLVGFSTTVVRGWRAAVCGVTKRPVIALRARPPEDLPLPAILHLLSES
jgi:hypothetical protein